MANDFNASLVISTAASETGIRNLDAAYKNLDKTLAAVSSSLKAGQSDLDKVSASMKVLTDNNRTLIRSDKDRAAATVGAAKAEAIQIGNNARLQTSAGKQRITDAKANAIAQKTVAAGLTAAANSTRRDAETGARVAATQALSVARVGTESVRTATAQVNLGAATTRAGSAADSASARTARLADTQRRAADSTLSLNDNLSNSRYLLYDVGQTYSVISAALLAIPVATAAVAIAYEKDFAQVIRTNDSLKDVPGGFENLRQDLKDLATQIPLTFSEFSKIAAIGGQLGIAGSSMEAFTETVAKFGAATNVSLDDSATAFGRLQNSFDPLRQQEDFFNKVGSSIAYVGVKSAATETEIIAVSNQISAAGAQFGFTADQVVGLSGALASVRIRPELARGAFQRIMLGLSSAADQGADSFSKFGKYTGLAGQAAVDLFKKDPSAFFYKYIGGVKQAIKETGSVSTVLSDIGAKNVFDKQFILGLANGYQVFGDSLSNASTAFNEGTFLNSSTQGIFETLDAKIKRITNGIQNFQDTIAKGTVGEGSGLAKTADAILSIAGATDRFARATPGFTQFINLVLGLGSAIGILLAFKAAQAFLLAGLVGFQQVLGKGTLAAGLTAKGILQQVAVTMLMAKGATDQQAAALVKQVGAWKAVGVAASTTSAMVKAGVLAGIGGVSTATPAATSKLKSFGGGLAAVGRGALGFVGGPAGALIIALGAIGLAFIQAEEKANAAGDAIARAGKNGSAAAKTSIAEQLISRTVDSYVTDLGSGGVGNHGKNVRELANEVGISFDSIVNSVSKGKDANKDFLKVLDEYSKTKGFADYADLTAKSGTNLVNKKGELRYLARVVDELGTKSAKSAEDVKAIDATAKKAGDTSAAAAPEVDGLKGAIEDAGAAGSSSADDIDAFVKSLFGISDANAATEASLQKIGEGIGASTDFTNATDGGRTNIANFKDALSSAITEQQQLIDTTGKTTQQASADYIAFVEGLVAEMTSRGVDPAQITDMANRAKTYFGAAVTSGAPVAIPVGVDSGQVYAQGVSASDALTALVASYNPKYQLGVDPSPANAEINGVAMNLAQITGYPYQVVVDALTNPASEKGQEIAKLLTSITKGTYVAPVNADTSAFITNIRNAADWAQKQLAAVQSSYNQVAASAPVFAQHAMGAFKGVTGVTNSAPAGIRAPSASSASVAQVAAPVQVAAPKGSAPDFNGLADGYNNVRDAANKAGDAGNKAGKDMANGIDDATSAANDYASRLKTGLQSAFDLQYGLQKATDDYYSALNAITKKHDDELAQIDDLITKQKELNNERNDELVNARKAGIEKNISSKYGETARAMDYAAQEQTALDAAAAKQKDIDANDKTAASLQAGITDFTSNSDAAIANREALRGLESKMLDMITAYAATGASQEQVRAYAQKLTAQFQTDVGQIWQNRVATNALTGELTRYIIAINSVPQVKPTTISADTGQATGAVNAFNAAADWAARNRQQTITTDWQLNHFVKEIPGYAFQGQQVWGVYNNDGSSTGKQFFNKGGQVQGFASGGQVPGTPPSNPGVDNLMAKVDGKGAVGIRSGEFITQEPAVKFWGLDFMNAINNMKMPRFNAGGAVGGGSGSGSNNDGPVLVELTAENLQAILRLAERDINLFAGVEKLASSVNEGQKILASKGVS